MIGMIKSWVTSKQKDFQIKIKEAETIEKMIQEIGNQVLERPKDDGFYHSLGLTESEIVSDRQGENGWTRTDQVTDREKGHLQTNQIEMIRQARNFYRWDSFGRSLIQTMVNYIMGKGLNITPKSKDPVSWWIWRDFWTCDRNKMELKQFEIVWRLFRDGEVFIEFFKNDDDGNETGKTTIRFVDPLLIRNPGGDGKATPKEFEKTFTRSGIQYDQDDVEKIIRYWVMSNADTQEFRFILADDMVHIKIFSDSDQKRGESFLQPVMRLMRQYNTWLENRILLNKMRTAIVMIKKITGTPAQVSQMSQTLQSAKHQRYGENKKESIKGGSVIVANAGVDYKMESPNINAADVKDDGREIKLNIATGCNVPEYILGDASNANYASTLVAEAPFVKAIEYWQIFIEFYWKRIYKKVIENAVAGNIIEGPNDKEFMAKLMKVKNLNEAVEEGEEESPKDKAMKELMPDGKLEAPSEVFFGCDMQWPDIIHRQINEFTTALTTARQNGWISDSTASSALGYDFTEEMRKQKQIVEEAKKDGNDLLGMNSDGLKAKEDEGDMDNEISDVINNLTDEERKELISKTDPKDIVSMLMKKAEPNGNVKGGSNAGNKTRAGIT